MGRACLVAAIVLGFVGHARADVARCSCPDNAIFPDRTAQEVPLNTKIWVFDAVTGPYQLSDGRNASMVSGEIQGPPTSPVVMLVPGVLQPHTRYSLDDSAGGRTTFLTGDKPDVEAPAAPEISVASITTLVLPMTQPADRQPVAGLMLAGRFDADVALVRVSIADAHGTVMFLTRPNAFLCNPGIQVAAGKATLTVRAIDLAGNESPPVTMPIDIAPDPSASPDRCSEHARSHGCGLGSTMLVLVGIGGAVALILAIVTIVMFRLYRRRAVPGPAEPLSLLVVEHAARSLMTRMGVLAVLGVTGIAAMVVAGVPVFPWLVGLWTLPALRSVWLAAAALRLLERASATSEVAGSTLIVRAGDRSARLVLSASELAAAKRRGIPKASA